MFKSGNNIQTLSQSWTVPSFILSIFIGQEPPPSSNKLFSCVQPVCLENKTEGYNPILLSSKLSIPSPPQLEVDYSIYSIQIDIAS